MGLAASQARLLFLTSRQNNLEFSQMRIANDKISLSRETEGISEDYNRALNQRKLLWTVDGSSTSSDCVNLTYGLIMQPNDVNQAGQYILTNNNGKVVLSNDYIAKLGLAASGGAGEIGMTRNQFLEKFDVDGVQLDAEQYDDEFKAESGSAVAPANYQPKSAISDKLASTITTDINKYKTEMLAERTSLNSTTAYAKLYNDLQSAMSGVNVLINKLKQSSTTYTDTTTIDGQNYAQYEKEQKALTTLGEFVVFINTLNNSDDEDGSSLKAIFGDNPMNDDPSVSDVTKFIDNFINTLLTGNTNSVRDNAYWNAAWGSGSEEDTGPAKAINYYMKNKGFVSENVVSLKHNAVLGLGSDGTYTFKYSGTILDSILSNARAGAQPNTKTNPTTTAEESAADFYTNLYYAIYEKGWKNDSSVDDSGYLQNQLMNGNLQLERLTASYTWDTLTSADADTPVRNVADEEAITLAESKYNMAKSKLETKENLLDLQAKNLDAERSEIVTETDSVKKIIDKNIEKSFKMFQA